jgi:hypothetical protein
MSRGVLDHPLSRMMTAGANGATDVFSYHLAPALRLWFD